MLDPDEVADYEAWKLAKLNSSQDLSVRAYNMEMEANALSWEEGWRAHANGESFDSNRFRKPGMRGERRAATDLPASPGTTT